MTESEELTRLKVISIALGYSFEVSPDGTEQRMIRPDGTVAVIARRPAKAMS